MKNELQQYLNKVYTNSKVDTPYSIAGKVYLRFELGDDLPNGSVERVNQATERAMVIINSIFEKPETNIYVLAYEYQEDFSYLSSKYFHEQINIDDSTFIHQSKEMLNSRTVITDENGVEMDEKIGTDLSIYKAKKKEINFENIARAIANKEMGFDPRVYEEIYFFNLNTDIIFRMYDDRGCFVWSNNSENLRELYETKNDWIVDYDRPKIDKQFLD